MIMQPWQIRISGQSWTNDQVVTAHGLAVAGLLDDKHGFAISPWDGFTQLFTWCAVLLASARATPDSSDMDVLVQTVMNELSMIPIDSLLGSLSVPLPPPVGPPTDDEE